MSPAPGGPVDLFDGRSPFDDAPGAHAAARSEHGRDGIEQPEQLSGNEKHERADDPKLDPERGELGFRGVPERIEVGFRRERVMVGARGGAKLLGDGFSLVGVDAGGFDVRGRRRVRRRCWRSWEGFPCLEAPPAAMGARPGDDGQSVSTSPYSSQWQKFKTKYGGMLLCGSPPPVISVLRISSLRSEGSSSP